MVFRVLGVLGACAATTAIAACSTVLGLESLALAPTTDDASTTGPGDETRDGGSDGADAAVGADAAGDAATETCIADLTSDPKHCGRCNHDCLGGSCNARTCTAVKLADGLAIPEGIAVDSAFVFVADNDQNRILKFEKSKPSVCMASPTPSQCVFTPDQNNVFKPTAVAVDSTRVFWANTGRGQVHAIRSCPLASCGGSAAAHVATLGVEALGHLAGDSALPLKMVIRGGRIYWAENLGGAIRSANVDGSDPRTHLESATHMPVDIAVDDTHIYFTDDSNQHAAQIQAVAIAGGEHTVLASLIARPHGIALSDAGVLFWTIPRVGGAGDGLIQSAPKAGLPGGGAPVGAFATGQVEPEAIIVDETNVYWVQSGAETSASGMVVYCPQTGCPSDGPIVLAAQQNRPRHITQDEQAIYWSNEGLVTATVYDGQVWKIAKP